MKTPALRPALVLLFSLSLTGCVFVPHGHPFSSNSSALTGSPEDCPPGHRWSDGRCHSKGKGHDKDKHGKGKGHD